MSNLELSICAGIGDNLVIRVFFDNIKNNYQHIKISHDPNIVNYWRNGDPKYYKFLEEMGGLLFSESPYSYDKVRRPLTDLDHISRIIDRYKIIPQKPNMDHLLCKGQSLNLGEEYIVITTKIRHLYKKVFYPLSPQLWSTLKELSKKYKIVILGEKDVEKSKEYLLGDNIDNTYGIYEQIIANIPEDRIVDLTIPALGITVPDMSKIQQDCLIMKEAKCVITLGIGGNLWLSLCVANTIGYRSESLGVFTTVTDKVTNPTFPTAFLSKDWSAFIKRLEDL